MADNTELNKSVSRRVFALLNAFTLRQPALRLVQLSQATGLPVSTVHRMAAELVEIGALERESDGRYRIGLRLWELGSLCSRPNTLREVALPYMHDLYEATSENVQLAVLDGAEALYIERVWGNRSVPVASRVGGRLPLYATGVGKVLLGYAPPTLQETVLRAGLHRYTSHTVVMPGALARTLRDVRASGIARCIEEMTLGTMSVATPIFDKNRQVVAALSIVMHSRVRSPEATEAALRVAASSISRQLAKNQYQAGDDAEMSLAEKLPRRG
ncbi:MULTISPECIES: IclR family transcriptional regulator [Streptomyces]|uniref:IclR family transcriptional regulator n=3 Tax=Streptomyces TaxID=1883 RepID=A0ABD5JGM3_9ACTN|nr:MULTISPECIES: IclR family transcriptional regulator [Streptomyces]MEE4587215.1 IclR family transcriptional regulator [Streptomyces sp. DSM 41602]KUL66407.1 IclR family transcriptional regulator [Streptomyces violaceusniger]QTI90247.1 IclR family transcriptional regulator [Streptomyces sp. AgN23]WJD96346.1 IclR family transcriptional regulator [Streptomyces antimycoticus]WTA86366.1 IclR family transcriptional regulator [Streptomyces antimycoticus]